MIPLLLLALFQDPDPKRVDELVQLLRSEDAAVRDGAVKKLIELGEKVLPLLEKHETSKDADVRSRVAQVVFKLRPWKVEPVANAAKTALKEGSRVEDWRPAVKAQIEKLLEELGADVADESKRDALKAISKCFEDGMKVVRENADGQKGAIYLVAKARGTEVDRGAILVCESAEFDKVDDSIIICLGDVKIADELNQSIVIATGKVSLGGGAKNAIIVCGGAFAVGDKLRDCTVVAAGGCPIGGDSKECVFVNTKVTAGGKSENDRHVEKARLPSASK